MTIDLSVFLMVLIGVLLGVVLLGLPWLMQLCNTKGVVIIGIAWAIVFAVSIAYWVTTVTHFEVGACVFLTIIFSILFLVTNIQAVCDG